MLDSHLLTLQVLSAHIKLLLDAPEQLWRLIEGEKYFQAAWLFLLASVVHRALVRDDAEDEDGWFHQGIDIHVRRYVGTFPPFYKCLLTGAIPVDSKAMGYRIAFSHSDNT